MRNGTATRTLLIGFLLTGSAERLCAQPSLPRETIPDGIDHKLKGHMEQLYSVEPRERVEAAGRLCGGKAMPAVPFLLALLHDNTPAFDEREWRKRGILSSYGTVFSFPRTPGEAAALSLARIDQGRRAVPPLLEILTDKRWVVRANAVRALGEAFRAWRPQEVRSASALEPLMVVLKDKHPRVRQYAARVLGMLRDPHAVPPLLALLKNDKELSQIRVNAAESLGEIGDSEAVPVLITALKDANLAIRLAATSVAGIRDERAVEPLLAMLRDKNRQVREVTAGRLGDLADERVVKALIAAMQQDDYPNVRGRAAVSLGALRDDRAVKPLMAALRDRSAYVRRLAGEALKKFEKDRR